MGYEIKTLPVFFEIEDVKYGQIPKSKDNLINIIDAPDSLLAKEQYKDYYIRDVKLLKTNQDVLSLEQIKNRNKNFMESKIQDFFILDGTQMEIVDCINGYLAETADDGISR